MVKDTTGLESPKSSESPDIAELFSSVGGDKTRSQASQDALVFQSSKVEKDLTEYAEDEQYEVLLEQVARAVDQPLQLHKAFELAFQNNKLGYAAKQLYIETIQKHRNVFLNDLSKGEADLALQLLARLVQFYARADSEVSPSMATEKLFERLREYVGRSLWQSEPSSEETYEADSITLDFWTHDVRRTDG